MNNKSMDNMETVLRAVLGDDGFELSGFSRVFPSEEERRQWEQQHKEVRVFQQERLFSADTIRQVITYDESGKVIDIQSTNLSEVERQECKARKQKEKERKAQKAREDWEKAPILVKLMFWVVVLLPVVGIASCCLKG